MRLLLDESVPRPLAHALSGHEVQTVKRAGWEGLRNGELLDRAAEAGFDALITVDKGFEFQQNLGRLSASVVLLRASGNRLEDLEPLVPEMLQKLEQMEPRTFLRIDARRRD